MNDATVAKNEAIVITITSRFWTCVSSWPMTPSSSAGESSSSRPVVAQTVAVFGERPIANAFGMRVSAIATRGFGRSAWTHSRSTIACSCGASCGETSRAPIARSASLSDVNSCRSSSPPAITAMTMPLAPAANSTPTKITYTSPSRNSVNVIRSWRPVSLPKEVGRGDMSLPMVGIGA